MSDMLQIKAIAEKTKAHNKAAELKSFNEAIDKELRACGVEISDFINLTLEQKRALLAEMRKP